MSTIRQSLSDSAVPLLIGHRVVVWDCVAGRLLRISPPGLSSEERVYLARLADELGVQRAMLRAEQCR